MPELTFPLTALVQELDNGALLAEALLSPEVSCFAEAPGPLLEALARHARALLKSLAAADLYRRRLPGPVAAGDVTVELAPPPRSLGWRQPVTLTLPVLRWAHGNDARLAFVPALGIEVVAASDEDLERILPNHVRTAVLRSGANALHRLVWLARARHARTEPLSLTVELPTPRQLAVAAQQEQQAQHSVLDEVATDLTRQHLPEAFGLDDLVARLAEALTGRDPRSALLIGPSGVGKTAALHELVRRRAALGLGRTPFWATSGARLVAGMSGFGMWQERCQRLWREASSKRAVLHLGSLMELLDVGKSEHQQQGLAAFLRPYFARGDLLAVVECSPEQLPLIERQSPHLLRAFAHLRLEEPAPAQLRTVLARVAGRRLEPAGLDEVLRLHRRYAAYSANPGRPLRFLRNLLADRPDGRPARGPDVTAAFARETGLPLVLLEDDVRLDLAEARAWFEKRVLGQAEAVDQVVDLLATVKAALNRPRKPIASLLFIGPTGVGKTEMAKALAAFLFGSEQRLTRFDMSEYADPLALSRLIGGPGAREGLLTARVREQPFSVVLLDEVEKAHPQLFDLLLQVLGEGRLTDASGRLADFCNSVVLMTSNLGADTYRQGDFGLVGARPARDRAREHFEREVRAYVRPELFNRIIAFAPLDEPAIHRIAVRQLELLGRRDGVRYRGVTLELAPDLAAWLARRGFDARYGARPLKRAIERELLAPLAGQMNEYTADTPLRVCAGVEGGRLKLQVRARGEAGDRASAAAAQLAEEAVGLRRDLQRLQGCAAAQALLNDIYHLEKMEKRPRYDPHLDALRRVRDDLEAQLQAAVAGEDEALLALYGQAGPTDRLPASLVEGRRGWRELLLALYLLGFDRPDDVCLAVFSEEAADLFSLAAAYYAVATRAAGARVAVWQFVPPRGAEKGPERRLVVRPEEAFAEAGPILARRLVVRPPEEAPAEAEPTLARPGERKREARLDEPVLVNPRKGVVGLGLEVHAPGAFPRFAPEAGLHLLHTARDVGRCLVDTGADGRLRPAGGGGAARGHRHAAAPPRLSSGARLRRGRDAGAQPPLPDLGPGRRHGRRAPSVAGGGPGGVPVAQRARAGAAVKARRRLAFTRPRCRAQTVPQNSGTGAPMSQAESIVCRCGRRVTYFAELLTGSLSCPGCGAVLVGARAAEPPPRPAPREEVTDAVPVVYPAEGPTPRDRKAPAYPTREGRDEPRPRERPRAARTSGLAVVAFALALLSLVGLVALAGAALLHPPTYEELLLVVACAGLSLLTLILAILALGQVRRSRGRLAGKGLAVGTIVCSLVSMLVFCPGGTVLVATQKAREAAQRATSANNLKQVGQAMHSYHDTNRGLPAASSRTRDGKPGLSWRVHLLPYLEQEPLYRSFRLDEPWDSPHNKALLTQLPRVYALPGKEEDARQVLTYYQVFVGKGTAFEPPEGPWEGVGLEPGAVPFRRGRRFAEFSDGTANTTLVAEAARPVPWTKPEDLAYDPAGPLPDLGAQSRDRFQVVMADGSIRAIPRNTPEHVVRALITRNGGEVLPLDW
jgi:ATP-dependent Clp protease ATP-binding subunit ClpA